MLAPRQLCQPSGISTPGPALGEVLSAVLLTGPGQSRWHCPVLMQAWKTKPEHTAQLLPCVCLPAGWLTHTVQVPGNERICLVAPSGKSSPSDTPHAFSCCCARCPRQALSPSGHRPCQDLPERLHSEVPALSAPHLTLFRHQPRSPLPILADTPAVHLTLPCLARAAGHSLPISSNARLRRHYRASLQQADRNTPKTPCGEALLPTHWHAILWQRNRHLFSPG